MSVTSDSQVDTKMPASSQGPDCPLQDPRSNSQSQLALKAILENACSGDEDEDIYKYAEDDKPLDSPPSAASPNVPFGSLRMPRRRSGNFTLRSIASPTSIGSVAPLSPNNLSSSHGNNLDVLSESPTVQSEIPTSNSICQRTLSEIFEAAFGDDDEEEYTTKDEWQTCASAAVTSFEDVDVMTERVSSPYAANLDFFACQRPDSVLGTANGYKYAGSSLAGVDSTTKTSVSSAGDKQGEDNLEAFISGTGDDEDVSMQDVQSSGMIDQDFMCMFNCWGLLDYQQYLWKIETSHSDKNRRLNSTILLHPDGAQNLSVQGYNEGSVFTEHATDMCVILIDQLPLADADEQFHGDVYLLAFDVPQNSFFVRRFLCGLPTNLDELSATWNSGRDVYNFKLADLISMIIESQEVDGSFFIPRLTDPRYCNVRDYPEELGMHIVIIIRLAGWVADFSDSLFIDEPEEELEEILGQMERCVDIWRLIVQRGTEEAWRAFDNNFSEETYRHKLTANKELATSLHDVQKPGRFGLHFLGGQRPPRPDRGPDKAWLGSFRRPQRTPTAEDVARVEARFGELFKAPDVSSGPAKLRLNIPLNGPGRDHDGDDGADQGEGSDSINVPRGPIRGLAKACRSELGLQLTTQPPKLPPRTKKLDSDRPLFGSLDSFRRPSKEAAALLSNIAESTRPRPTESGIARQTRVTKTTPALATDLFDNNPLEGDVEPFLDELDLPGLVTRMWQVAAQKPELDTTLARHRVRHLLRELGSDPGIPKHNEDLTSTKKILVSARRAGLGFDGAAESGEAHVEKVTTQMKSSDAIAPGRAGEETAACQGMAKEEQPRGRGWRRVFGTWF